MWDTERHRNPKIKDFRKTKQETRKQYRKDLKK